MPLFSLADFAVALPTKGALLGLDPGEKRIGVAASDPARRLATPVEQVQRGKLSVAAARIFELYDARQAAGLVLGLPLNMDGTAGPSAQSARAFARNLLAIRDVPALMWDERLSTAAVTRELLSLDMSRAKRAERVDMHAAAYVLQGALDRLRSLQASSNGTSE